MSCYARGVHRYGFADTLMIGHHSTEELAAAGLVNNIFGLVLIAYMGFSYGLTPVVGALFGRGEQAEAGQALRCSLLTNTLAAVAMMTVLLVLYFNLGNLECLSSQFVSAMENYDFAIKLYPDMGDAYFNRGLVLIYLKDNEKGCIDLSRAGELGVADAYGVISKYCKDEND